METRVDYWKELSAKLLKTFELMFLLNISMDFILTVLATATFKSEILFGISTMASMFLLSPWVLCILVLSIFLLMHVADCFYSHRHTMMVASHILTGLVYLALAVIAIFNPIISPWSIVYYLITVGWSVMLVHFRFKIKQALGE